MRHLKLLTFLGLAFLLSHVTPSAAQGRGDADDPIAAALAHVIANPAKPLPVGVHPVSAASGGRYCDQTRDPAPMGGSRVTCRFQAGQDRLPGGAPQ
jgi:hypothetical protein